MECTEKNIDKNKLLKFSVDADNPNRISIYQKKE